VSTVRGMLLTYISEAYAEYTSHYAVLPDPELLIN
jgi:hypothetical protein